MADGQRAARRADPRNRHDDAVSSSSAAVRRLAAAQDDIPGVRAPKPMLLRITCSVILGGVIASFRDKGTEDLFDGSDTKQARKACPSDLVRVARRKLDQLNQAAVLGDLRAPPSNRLEKLTGEREGQYSIRINDQWRVCFRWADSGAENVEIVDYH
jgi:toxin HigB-1